MPTTNPPYQLMDVARKCRECFDRAVHAIGPDLCGHSVLDLCADNLTDVPLQDLKAAIVCSGIYAQANARIQREIAAYR